MHPLRSSRILLVLAVLTASLTISSYVHADTYVLVTGSIDSNGKILYGMDDLGDFVLRSILCSPGAACYSLYVDGVLVSLNTPVPPALNYDDGTQCGVGFANSEEVCNSGRVAAELDIAGSDEASVYTGYIGTGSSLTDLGITRGFYDPLMDSMGDIVFDDSDYIREYIDVTSRLQATPEPSSIALLSTGLLGMAGMLRRRLRINVG